mmetsp:Transcript_169/g.191  ORF Transcript_169/g.191 Transcript_169/m.191 type:complete len:174 (+) Transcript_169:154-675(+)|eukprot:CAMPEP_0170800262 /NCGR_PEP_ID=MMETSP0733-20121128/27678_1 /TAXON_ID=186038 /ORGANISM="Fragilariopsis kerguelensis, Strain L26-C5" /LENGTH=173 /DNA_ID=CAMNT_0011152435 /DNA_START=124 /DNA_END=645 /DNA_ORIENTATION=+
MKLSTIFLALALAFCADAFSPQANKATTNSKSSGLMDLKKAAVNTMAAIAIGSTILTTPIVADALEIQPFFSSTNVVLAEKQTRQGVYEEYTVDITQEYDDARSTFKSAKETKSNKGKYTAILAILVVGSFIIPMGQYFWYVRDDDSSNRFFNAEEIPEPEPVKKKKGFFGKK